MYKIYVDPGHGGIDSGATSDDRKLLESYHALAVAQKLTAILPGKYFEVKMSRNSNHTPNDNNPDADLERRAREANAWGANIFVSIHLNAGHGTGVESYHSVLNGASLKLATDLMHGVNKECPDYKGHGDNGGIHNDDRDHNGTDYLCVIRETSMPAALFECGYIDNPADMSHWNANKFAYGLAVGICEYFNVPFSASATKPAEPAKAPMHYAPEGTPFKSDTTMDVKIKKGECYTVKLTCDKGCPRIHSNNCTIADVSILCYDGNDYFAKITGKSQGKVGISVDKVLFTAIIY